MKTNLDRLASAAAEILVEEWGFARDRRRFTREDELTRSAWFVAGKNASSAIYPFELILDLGLPGLTGSNAQPWVVRASAEKVYRKRTAGPGVSFDFRDGEYAPELERTVLDMLRLVAAEFFMTLRSADDLYRFVRRNALEFAVHAMAVDNEFKTWDLMPWNVLPRMQLAAVYAAYLGRPEDAAELETVLAGYAARYRLDHLMDGVRRSIAEASALGR